LEAFAGQAKVEVIYRAEIIRDVNTNAVTGEFTPREALERLIAGTELTVSQDDKTGALIISRLSADAAGKNHPEEESSVKEHSLKLEDFEVTGKRIDGLNNRGLLEGGENAPLYHDVVTSLDIERLGISSLEELFRYIPQSSSTTTSLQQPVNNVKL